MGLGRMSDGTWRITRGDSLLSKRTRAGSNTTSYSGISEGRPLSRHLDDIPLQPVQPAQTARQSHGPPRTPTDENRDRFSEGHVYDVHMTDFHVLASVGASPTTGRASSVRSPGGHSRRSSTRQHQRHNSKRSYKSYEDSPWKRRHNRNESEQSFLDHSRNERMRQRYHAQYEHSPDQEEIGDRTRGQIGADGYDADVTDLSGPLAAHNKPYQWDSLEREQSRNYQEQRRRGEGNEVDLTELAAPAPVVRKRPPKDSYERAERKADKDHGPDDENQLTEMAAPPPIVHDDARQKVSDEELASSQSPNQKDRIPSRDLSSARRNLLFTICNLIFWSLLGTLARLGTEAINRYPSAPFLSPVLWANVGGSFILGFLLEDRRLFREEWGSAIPTSNDKFDHSKHKKTKKTLPSYIGLSVGFCGSYTSFSNFMLDAFLALTNALPTFDPTSPYHTIPSTTIRHRSGGFSFEATLAVLIIQVSTFIAAYYLGAHLALALDPITPTISFKLVWTVIDPAIAILGPSAWLGAALLTVWPPGTQAHWRPVTLALCFAPLGCLLRWQLSALLNAKVPSFPLGTFGANVFGTAVLAMTYALQRVPLGGGGGTVGGSVVGCQVLQGVEDGFCGALTTVSTWVAELTTLRRRHAYIYGFASMVGGAAMMVVIAGSVVWTRGFDTPLCS